MLRLISAKNSVEYEYELETIQNDNFEIKSVKFDTSENSYKSLYTLVVAKSITQTGTYKLKIIGKIMGVKAEGKDVNVLIEIF